MYIQQICNHIDNECVTNKYITSYYIYIYIYNLILNSQQKTHKWFSQMINKIKINQIAPVYLFLYFDKDRMMK